MDARTIAKQERLSIARAREVLSYDPLTGVLVWRISQGKAVAGQQAGTETPAGYLSICIDGLRFPAHRLAWFIHFGEWPHDRLDHEDRNGLHNWIKNLRPCDAAENAQNLRMLKRNKTGFTGVSVRKVTGQFRADICYRQRRVTIGYFATAEEASAAYKAEKARLHTFHPTVE